ncbi:MBL fold hydrolase [Streptomyces hygroscopicus subsp. hygroscopicus]|uniref:MBL fold metallo-hydrolase n=1 Tax=Streptomyces sp. KHY 26 TaxID=3097359 RepID=UPI0024A57858|nr:MBL fold metallo-hydrolase [Streptomyces hygroscopicus]GLX49610.1 MBL fold hydrolase [Streptomyces hygroscopicus subsp. hygroscopicus]
MTNHTKPLVFVQFYLECLSHASYLVGDRTTGRAVVVDPQRDVNDYISTAERHGLTIERVIETHIHADFLSGHLELAERTGARISYGSVGSLDFDTDPLDDGEHLSLGEVDLEILHTPGHTPESICVVVREHADDAVPYGVLTGDTLFIGDVGRPDLLSSRGRSAEEMARALYHSTRERLLTLPDDTRVYPAHGAGSACGKNLSTELSCTIGNQRRGNYALADMTEDEFVSVVTEGQPAAPAYFAFTSVRNREARPVLDEDTPVPSLAPDAFLDARAGGAVVLDTRDPESFASSHLPGAVNVPLGGRFAELAGEVLDARDDIVLCGDVDTAREARNRLARIGFDRVLGALATPVEAVGAEYLTAGVRVEAPDVEARLAADADGFALVDVRGPGEVRENGTIPGALLVPLPELVGRLGELPTDRPLTVFCASGNRSSVAASVLRARGFETTDLRGGFAAWRGAVAHPADTMPGGVSA